MTDIKRKTATRLIDYVLENEEELTLEKAEELIANQKIKNKLENIVTAMNRIITPFQREIIKEVVSHINDMTERISKMNEIIERYMKEYEENLKRL